MSSNLAVLTHSHKIIASKKRARREQVKEVLFDDDARRDYLTGFHKRKVAKKETAKKKAIEREKQERLGARREKRQMLAEQAVQNAREVEKAYGAIVDSEDEDFVGFSDPKGKGKATELEDEYSDEEQLATVTVVEEFDPQALLHGPSTLSKSADGGDAEKPSPLPEPVQKPPRGRSSSSNDIKKVKAKVVKKAKDIKYQTKADRKADRTKQQRRKVEKAERAGGRSSRKPTRGRGKR
ncbi:hypothetical protein QCA50_009638 [Cerrena zonata]|uniref:Nucleolar protein 12 n=1 Tax=Cerrena zonata TaxID=2478898 RepID=A0AAW0G0Z3_9APHY